MNISEELERTLHFAMSEDLSTEIVREQLRCLWTAHCIHHNFGCDTGSYDSDLLSLWSMVEKYEPDTADWHDFNSFDEYMCRYLC